MQPTMNMARQRNWMASGGAAPVPSAPRRTTIDCVATAAMSQAPLMPVASEGLHSRIVTAVKKAYITRHQSATPLHQSAKPISMALMTMAF